MAIENIGLVAVTENAAKKVAVKVGGKIKAQAGTKYLLQVEHSDVAPENVTVKRVGKDLVVSFEGSEKPDLTIEDFFADGMDGQLYGVAEDGQLYAYVRTDGEGFGGPLLMADGESAPIALGGDSLGDGAPYLASTFDDAAGFVLWPWLLGLAGIGAAAAAVIHHNQDSGKHHHTATSPAPSNLKAVDDVGPIQGQLHDGDVTDDAHPAISGNGVPGAIIHVFDNGQEIGSTTVNPDGTWSFTPELADGAHDIDVTQQVPGEKPSAPIKVVDIVVDTTPPAEPTAQVDGAKTDGDHTYSNDDTPTMSGTGEPGDKIIIVYPTGEVVTTTVDDTGHWVAPEPTLPLPEGENDIKVIDQDPAGNQTEITVPVIIDTTAPTAPEAHLDPASDTGVKGDDITSDKTPTIDGKSEPGADISVTFPTGEVVTTTADANGDWSVTPTQPLPEGNNDITVIATDPAGNASEPTVIAVVIDTTAPTAPEAHLDPASDTGIKGDGITNDTTPTIDGKTEPGADISVTFPTGEVVTTTADANGDWSVTPTQPLPEGNNDITVIATDPAGNQSEPTVIPVVIDTSAPTAPEAHLDPASDTGIKGDGITNDTTPTIDGKTEPGADISVTFPTGEVVTTTADANGDWSVTPTQPLPEGDNDITVIATDPAGNPSEPTIVPVVIDTQAPSAPEAHLDPASDSGTKGDGITNDTTPTIDGKTEPGADISVTFPTGEVVTTTADANGDWSVTPTQPLPEGKNDITVIAIDPAGNPSEPTIVPVVIDTQAPTAPDAWLDPASDSGIKGDDITNDATPTIDGKAEPGADIAVTFPTGEVVTTTADANGDWSVTPTQPLPEGNNDITVIATDPAGNPSEPTVIDVVIDTTPPDASKLAITGVLDEVGSITGNVENGGKTDDSHPIISGTGTAGDTIVVFTQDATGSNHAIGSATVDADGKWSFKPELPLVSGLNELTAVESDAAGNHTTSKPYDITLDMGAPAAPVIVSVVDDVGPYTGFLQKNDVTDDNQPTFNGNAQPGSTVKLYDDGKLIGSGTTDANGNWSITTDKLADGPHDVTATATNAIGVVSEPTGVWPFTVDTTAPANVSNLVITDDVGAVTGPLHDGDTTDDNQPTFSGNAEPNGTVVIFDNGTPIGSTTVDPEGDWSFTPTKPLPDGDHDFTTEVVDPAGNNSGQNDPVHVIIDTSGVVVSITKLVDDVGSVTGDIAKGGVTDDQRPEINGTGKAGSTVVVFEGQTQLGSTTVKADGTWSLTPSKDLSEGNHVITAVATDKAGASATSSPFDFTIDITAPSKPTIDSVTDDVGAIQGPIVNGGVTDDPTPTLAGKAEAGSTVVIYDNGQKAGSTTADKDGNWTYTPTSPINEGPHEFEVTATDKAGNTSAKSDPFDITTDYTAPTAPAITGVDDHVGTITGPIANGGMTDDQRPEIHGTGTAGDVITVYTKDSSGANHAIGSTTVGDNGTWTLQPSQALASGVNDLTAVESDPAGNKSVPSASYSIDVEPGAPAAPVIVSVFDDVGPYTGYLQKNAVTDDNQPTFNGTAQPGSTVKLYDGDKLIGSTTTDGNGNWSITTDKLADGPHDVTATATNAIGVVSEPTGVWPFTVDTTAPANVSNLVITDDVGAVTGPLHDGDTTDDNQPTFSGNAEPNGTVIIFDNGTPIGSTTVDPNGDWSFTPTKPLPNGDHDFTTEVVDPAGNNSGQNAPVHVIIDTSGVVVSITKLVDDVGSVTGDVAKGGITDDQRPEIHGTGKPGSTVVVSEGQTSLGTATVKADGTWSLTPSKDLSEGNHVITAVATDKAGVSATSSPFDFIIDITAPSKPTIDSATDDVGAIQGPIVNGGMTDDPTPTLAGKAEAGSTVVIYDNGQKMGSTTADKNGGWTYTPSTPISEGEHDFTVDATDKAGNTSAKSDPFVITTDYTAPAAPVISNVVDDFGPITGNIANGGATDDKRPEIQGTAEAKAKVTVYDGATVLGTTTADATGKWSFTPSSDLSEGKHDFKAIATDAAGNTGPQSNLYSITTDYTPPVATLTIGTVTPDDIVNAAEATGTVNISGTSTGAQAGDVVTLTINGKAYSAAVDATGKWTVNGVAGSDLVADSDHKIDGKLHATDAVGNFTDATATHSYTVDTVAPSKPVISNVVDDFGLITGNIANGGATDDKRPEIQGTTEAGAKVTVYDGSTVLGTTTADATGKWSFTPTSDLPEGKHDFKADATDAAGNTSVPSDPYSITTDYTPPVATLSIGNVTSDNVLNAAEAAGTVSLSGTSTGARAGDVVTLTINGKAYSAAVDASGNWTVTGVAGSDLVADSDHQIDGKLHATDAVGNYSDVTASRTYTVDTVAPNKPVITTVVDDFGPVTGNIANGGVTDDKRPEVQGTAEANAKVTVYDGSTVLGTTTADATGKWSFTPSSDLAAGQHDFKADATDAAGNTSVKSDPYSIIGVYTGPSATLAIDTVTSDNVLNAAEAAGTVNLSGTSTGARAGDVVTLTINGKAYSTTVDSAGKWTVTVAGSDLAADSDHQIDGKLHATDLAGNFSDVTATRSYNVDTVAPSKPVISNVVDDFGPITGNIANGGATDDKRPEIQGTTEAGAKVTVYDGSTVLGTTTADAAGKWSFTPTSDLPEGKHDFKADATDAAGNTSVPSDPYSITTDYTPPVATLSIGNVTSDNVLNAAEAAGTVNLSGTSTGARAGDVVTLTINGKAYSAAVDASGNWTVTGVAGSDLVADSDHQIDGKLHATDAVGNYSDVTASRTYTVDTVAPNKPVITTVVDDFGPVTGNIANGGVTDDKRPEVQGTAEANAKVTVYDGSTVLGTTTADATGKWSFTPSSDLAAGQHDFKADATDAAGNTSVKSDPYSIIGVYSGPSATLAIDTVTSDNVINATEAAGTVNITGTSTGARAGDVVTLTINGKAYSTTVDSAGKWTVTGVAGSDLVADSDHQIDGKLHATDVAGNFSDVTASRTYTVDTVAPNKPVISNVVDDFGPITGNIANGGATDDKRPEIQGTAEANAKVTVYDGSTVLGTTTADGTGKWSFTPTSDLSEGLHDFKADATDAAGNTGAKSDPYSITTDYTPPVATLSIGSVTADNVINAAEAAGTVNLSGTSTGARAGDVVTLTINGKAYSTSVDSAGNWTVTGVAGSDLVADSDHKIDGKLHATDAVGNYSDVTASQSYGVDTIAPAAPVITTVVDDFGPVTGNIDNGGVTDDKRPQIQGTTEANAKVTVYDGSTVLGTTTADATGKWSFTPSSDLTEGRHDFQAAATDAAGNTGAQSNVYVINTDYTGPTSATTQLTVDPVAGDDIVDSTEASGTQTISGKVTGEFMPGDKVSFTLDGTQYTATVAANGTWSVDVPGSKLVSDAAHEIDATLVAHDAAGNVGSITTSHPYSVQVNSVSITGMSKDTAIDLAHSTDFITADGSAGRGVYGTLTQALTGNQTVQVSFDGGSTWANAVTNGTNWAITDGTVHSSNWAIEARVMDGSQVQTPVAIQNVTYLGTQGSAPTITGIPDIVGGYTAAKAADGSDVNVSLSGTLAKAGDTVHIIWGNTTYDQVLTAADITAGTVTAKVPAQQTTTQGASYNFSVSAQIITQEGQISPPSTVVQAVGQGTTTYNSDSLLGTPSGNMYYGNGFTVSSNTTLSHGNSDGQYTLSGLMIANPTGSISTSRYMEFDFSQPISSFAVTISGLQNNVGGSQIVIYDTSGRLVSQQYATADGSGGYASSKYFSYSAPAGTEIGKVMIYADGVDVAGTAGGGINVSSLSYYQISHSSGTVNGQTLIDHNWETYFDDNGNTSHTVSMSVDPVAYFAQSTAHVHGGAAMDTLKLTGANQVLDLRSLTGDNDMAKISSIEKFDITGTGNNTLKISLNDVLNLGTTDLFQKDGKVQVMVDGNAGDKVELYSLHDHGSTAATWQNAGTTTVSGATYTVYSSTQLDAEVLIKQAVTATIV